MKTEKILFISSITSILFLIFLFNITNPIYTGKIESITESNEKITIQLQNSKAELIIFNTNHINLTKDDNIKFQGKQTIYKNKTQIIINKINKIK